MKRPTLMALLFIVFCANHPSWADEKNASSNLGQPKDSWTDSKMDVDKETDDGSDDDKSNESTEGSKFQKDMDDAYTDTSEDKDDSSQSRFKDDQDDDDKGADDSDSSSDMD